MTREAAHTRLSDNGEFSFQRFRKTTLPSTTALQKSPLSTKTPETHRNGAQKPKIGVTMGDAAGIGPEIILKALARPDTYALCQPIVIGSPELFQEAIFRWTPPGRPHPKLNTITTPAQARARHGTIDVLRTSALSFRDISIGTVNACAGAAAVKAIETATQLAMAGELDAITTAPLCKASMHRAGFQYPGHTEMLAAFTNTPNVVMMLCTAEALMETEPVLNRTNCSNKGVGFAVSFVTNHIALADVTQQLSVQRIVDVIRLTQQALLRSGISEPHIVVAGLNPHAGEEGLFGKEEAQFISPAIAQAQAHAHVGTIEGPLPADALFVKAIQGAWHAVIAMYHDQGNIPIKLLGFNELVNVTLGLPIVRTSVGHGTAFDIAGKGLASETSLVAALKCAAQLTQLANR